MLCLLTCMTRFGILFRKHDITRCEVLSLQYQLTPIVRVQSTEYWQSLVKLRVLPQLRIGKFFNTIFCRFILDAVSAVKHSVVPRCHGNQNKGGFQMPPTHSLLLLFATNVCRILHHFRVINPFSAFRMDALYEQIDGRLGQQIRTAMADDCAH